MYELIAGVGNSGNAASRVQEFIDSKGSYAYGGYPDIDDLFEQQARERDPRKREALLHRIHAGGDRPSWVMGPVIPRASGAP